ncbi:MULTISPECIES: oligogalacturonate lyase family protein [unclassified Azospirillum]|uniref:oligogalacturonate lyase family protein n=1 Tax=unclassified Azospirillum TaxID=2630922 RepID=UPI000B65654F|nr:MULTISPECIES: oligogalacturonate lyase family protein [unclassified Azospirillum]SNS47606.1 oligogalacturonide lyase [Azospirillum sp. RU38E]SNS66780.1 oligogalacturonide lyase [Azospirillum sp. RU37A]
MKKRMHWLAALALLVSTAVTAAEPPREWVDPDTGHRVVRLSSEPGSRSLYFHQNAYTPDGKRMVVSAATTISIIDLDTRKQTELVKGEHLAVLFVGPKTGRVYYANDDVKQGGPYDLFWIDSKGGKPTKIAHVKSGRIESINADETLLLGTWAERDFALQPGAPKQNTTKFDDHYAATGPDGKPLSFADAKEVRLNDRLEARIPMEIFTLSIKTGERKVVHAAKDWLNHVQFSPNDPTLLMFCHEGPWHKVDRIWLIRTDGTGLTKVHNRSMNMEIAGHEFFSHDGKMIWYDLQTPRGEDFWLAGYEIATGKRTWYHLTRDEWSVHYNVSRDGTLFAGDGGDAEMVAKARDGKWIYLFRPESIPDVAGISAPDAANLIRPGILRAEKLVNMKDHDYRMEPNITFTPDGKWVVFRANMHGEVYTYAVEVAKAAGR